MSETAAVSLRVIEVFQLFNLDRSGLDNGRKYHLGDSHTAFYSERLCRMVNEQDLDLTPVV